MNLVKIIVDDDGVTVDNPKWHIVDNFAGDPRVLCTAEVYCMTHTRRVEYELKYGKLKDCDCPNCLEIVKWFKSLK